MRVDVRAWMRLPSLTKALGILVLALVSLAVLSGCARHTYNNSPSAFPGSPSRESAKVTTRSGCDQAGGTWNVATERCEVPY